MRDESQFFKGLGARIKRLREEAGESQEDMLSHGYSVRYWQKVEAGKPITLRTLLRICRIFSTPMCDVVRGLDRNPKRVHEHLGREFAILLALPFRYSKARWRLSLIGVTEIFPTWTAFGFAITLAPQNVPPSRRRIGSRSMEPTAN